MASRSAFGRDKNNTMPGTSRTQARAEARYNVTTQFPQYDLHFAAASGNLGLVEFALSHGQPINSVLNGVLPLHAACAGGSEVVVKYLIDEGADVNAPRIPRRYSNEKHKSSGLAVGASGSTPLHFAAANGHLGVVKLLLEHGAVPDRADKHGVTPEMLARENGWVECADLLAAWSGGRSGDLPPMQSENLSASTSASCSTAALTNRSANDITIGTGGEKDKERERDTCEIAELIQSGSRRLQMKRSIDNALHLFKAPLLHHGSHGQLRDRDRDRERNLEQGQEKENDRGRAKSPPSPSTAASPHSHPHSLFPLHSHHLHTHSHSSDGSPVPHSHLHSLFHHSHSHSTSQLQGQVIQSPLSQSIPSSAAILNQSLALSQRPRLLGEYSSEIASPISSSNPNPSPLDVLGVPGHRRPSLPQIFNEPASPFQRRLSGKKRRPRSAGEDPDQIGGDAGASTNNGNGAIGVNGPQTATPSGGGYATTNTGTITAKKLSSKISLRNLFRRAGADVGSSAGSNLSGSELSSNATSFSGSPAPIYSLAYANARTKGTSSPTPPASPLSASFAPSPAPTGGVVGGGRPSLWYRHRLGNEGASLSPVPRSPLVPSAVELHHRYSQGHLHEEFEHETQPENQGEAEGDVPVVAPQLSARPSILRGHNRSVSSQSSNAAGTPGGMRTLRFDASSVSPPSASPEPRWSMNMGNASAIRLRGTRSASSLRHEHSYGYDEEEEEEEDYGTSINPPISETADMLEYEEAVLEEGSARDLSAPAESNGYQYATNGRARGASFASSVSSEPEEVPEDNTSRAAYENKKFPFSIEEPPLTPLSVTSESSATHYGSPDDVTAENLSLPRQEVGKQEKESGQEKVKEQATESRARGESFSSVDTDESARSRNENAGSSTSAFTNITTPSPGTDLLVTPVLGGEDNDTDVPRTVKGEAPITEKGMGDAVYLRTSPSASLEDLNSLDVDADQGGELPSSTASKSVTPMTRLGLDLRGISNLAEAEELVRRAQQAILASASLPAEGPESPDVPLSAQLAAYGEILALERRFVRGEKQRENWGVQDDSDGEGGDRTSDSRLDLSSRKPQSAKEARMILTQKKRDAVIRQRGATTGSPGFVLGTTRGSSSLRRKGIAKTPKHKRPHTAEGAPQASWDITTTRTISGSPSASTIGPEAASISTASPSNHAVSHSRSSSTPTPLYLNKESEKSPSITIIETTATPFESPKTPESAAKISPTPNTAATDYLYTRRTIDDAHPALRSRTPDPDPSVSTDDFGVPLTRVATAPLQDTTGYGSGGGNAGGSYSARGSSSVLRSDPATRRTGSTHKLSKMGFSVDTHHHNGLRYHTHHSHSASPHHRSEKVKNIGDAYAYSHSSASPSSSVGSSRSPSKARFGGIKSLVKGLKGKS